MFHHVTVLTWRAAMSEALYGPAGFFTRGAGADQAGGAAHFRTSVAASPLFARAILRLVERVDEALGHPNRLRIVDVGAGDGTLLRQLIGIAGPLGERLDLVAV